MSENRIFTAITVLISAGVLILSGCSTPGPVEESGTATKSAVVTDAKTVKKDLVKAVGSKQSVKGKTGDNKAVSVKAKNAMKISVSGTGKAGSKKTGAKKRSAQEVTKKSVKSVRSSEKDKSAVMDNNPVPDKKEEPVNDDSDASDGAESAPDSESEGSDASENTETFVPSVPETPPEPPSEETPAESPAEPPVVIPETPSEEPLEEPPAVPAHEHTWEEIVELVHHDAVYGEPPLIAPAEDITYDVTEMHTICGICGANLDEAGVEHDYMHMEKGEGFWYYNDYIVVGQRTEHFDAEYGEPPLITPAYDEWVGTGRYRCTGCGETK